jgi:uncharacterized membrane protein YbhN (UPF0104 family)
MSRRRNEKTSTRRASAAAWASAVLLFAAVLAVMVHFSEWQAWRRLLRSLDPRWLLAAVVVQAATYFCAAAIWQVALQRERPWC